LKKKTIYKKKIEKRVKFPWTYINKKGRSRMKRPRKVLQRPKIKEDIVNPKP
jgi:hypothetical protein